MTMNMTQEAVFAALTANDHQVQLGLNGLYARGAEFEEVVGAVARAFFARERGEGDVRRLVIPPFITSERLRRTNYLSSMPHLAGEVETFQGQDREHRRLIGALESGDGWEEHFSPSGLVALPAVCENLYPLYAGTLEAPVRAGITSWCFRFEPSDDPMRMVSFRMAEEVYLGTPDGAERHRDDWRVKATDLYRQLELPVECVEANDPFFGRAGKLLVGGQADEKLKQELALRLYGDRLTALASVNLHRSMFGEGFGISLPDGAVAHSSCVGIGLERTAIALFAVHGMACADWPAGVRDALGLASH